MPALGPRPFRLTSPYDVPLDAPPDFSAYDYATPPEDDSAFQAQVANLQTSLNAPTGRRGFSAYDTPEEEQDVVPVAESEDAGTAPPTSEAANNPAMAKYAEPGSTANASPYEDPTGSEPPQSTPRGEADTGKATLTKHDVRRDGEKRPSTWDALRKKDEEIQRLKEAFQAPENAIGGLFANNVRGYWASLHQLEVERKDLYNQAVYEDNRRGTEPVGQPFNIMENGVAVKYQRLRNGQLQRLGVAEEDPRVQAKKVQSEWEKQKAGHIAKGEFQTDENGNAFIYNPILRKMEPVTVPGQVGLSGELGEGAGEPTPIVGEVPFRPSKTKTGGGSGVHYETDKSGMVWRYYDDPSKPPEKVGPLGKPQIEPERTPKEDPIEKAARDAYHDAAGTWLKDNPGDQMGAERQGRAAAGAARAYFKESKEGKATPQAFDPKNPPVGTKRRNKKTDKWEIFTTTGWQPYTGSK